MPVHTTEYIYLHVQYVSMCVCPNISVCVSPCLQLIIQDGGEKKANAFGHPLKLNKLYSTNNDFAAISKYLQFKMAAPGDFTNTGFLKSKTITCHFFILYNGILNLPSVCQSTFEIPGISINEGANQL